MPIDWNGVGAPGHRRVTLPTYPFERSPFWVRRRRLAVAPDDGEHPLLGRRLRSPLATTTFESHLGVDTLRLLDDHRVFGRAILPATAYLELALAAATETGRDLGLDDVVIHEALVAGDEPLHTVQTIVEPDSTGAAFKVFSQIDGADRWTLHASGRIGAAAVEPGEPLAVDTIEARHAEPIDADDHYTRLRQHGLDFGPALQGVRRIWTGDGEAFGEIALPAAQTGALATYRLHPALLDAGLQTLAALAAGDDTYLPVGIDRVRLVGAPTAEAWCHVVTRDRAPATDRAATLTADVRLYSRAGAPIAALDGLRLARADEHALLRLGRRDDIADWMYEVEWRDVPRPAHPAALEPAGLAAAAAGHVERLRRQHDLDRYQGLLDGLEALSTDAIVAALGRLGVRFEPGVHFHAADIDVADRHRRLLGELLGLLADDGVVARADDEWTVLRTPVTKSDPAQWDELLAAYPAGRGELAITRRGAEHLTEVLRGAVDPLQLLFPGGSLDDAEQLYQVSPFAHLYNSLAAEVVAAAVTQRPDDRRLRVLEVGAGTGGTTAHVLPQLPVDRTDYVFTDVSPLFLARAREKFAGAPFVDYRLLDIERDVAEQGFGGERFDIVIAANVLHATADLRHTFANVAELLAPGGLLVMVEMVRPQRSISITFGLTDGWWKFSDTDLRPSSLLLTTDDWRRFLADRGFTDPQALPGRDPGAPSAMSVQSVIVAGAPATTARGRWLILADSSGVGDGVAARLRSGDGRTVVVRRDTDVERVLSEAADDGFDAMLHLWSLDDDAIDAGLRSALHATQALIRHGGATRLWFVTRGAQPLGAAAPDPDQAALWGFARSVGLEHPELRPVCLDLDPAAATDPAAAIVDLLAAGAPDDQLALRGDTLLAARVVRSRAPAPAEPLELAVTERGTLDNLVVRPATRRAPGPGEVEIRVHATGLNFKDVLNALGLYPGDPGPLGGECAGVVVAVGDGVTDLEVGDAVVAVAPGSFRTHVTCSAALVGRKPATMTFAEAAGLLIPNITAEFALRHVGRLRAGERVLIHAAAGGVGLAAVALAQRCGAEVYATAGSEAKRAVLAALGVAHVYDSRSVAFADALMADTHDEGVDVVLNSLAGEFVAASLRVVRTGGRFLEIGKRDHIPAEAAARFDGEYHVIDWGQTALEDPDVVRSILSDVLAAATDASRPPIPVTTFPFERAHDAFRFMAQARHTGKIVVTQPAARADRPAAPIRADGTYLITGGLSGLGLLTARHLAERGARHLVLVGRRPPSAAADAEIAGLRAQGVEVAVVQGDVSRRDDIASTLELVAATMPPLRGVFHAAGVLDDGAVTQQRWDRFTTVLAPKVDGARHLHDLTQTASLDHFVLYASIASLVGSPGQTNHAAANAWLDALAHRRAAFGPPALSIDWGAWSEIGAAAERGVDTRAGDRGVGAIAPTEGLAALDHLLAGSRTQVGVAVVDWSVLLGRYPHGPPASLSELAGTTRPAAAPELPTAGSTLRLDDVPPHRRRAALLEWVRDQAAHVLDIAPGQLADRTPLSDLGLDSLMAVELRNLLGTALATATPLPATLVFDYPTVAAIATYLGDEVLALDGDGLTEDEPETPAPASGGLLDTLLEQLDDLSDDEIDRHLAERAGR
ncbi:MAG TPA: SDR family NAD(P)-dependent oxidoreductase [Acidimicrobiales bacterium]